MLEMRELLYKTRRTLGVIELKHALVPEELLEAVSLLWTETSGSSKLGGNRIY